MPEATEEAFIGALIKYDDQINRVRDRVHPDHFSSKCCREIYKIMLEEADMTGGCDLQAIRHYVGQKPWFISRGGTSFLQNCVDQAPPRHRIRPFARLVVSESINRDIARLGEMARKAADEGEKPDKIISTVQEKIKDLNREAPTRDFKTIEDHLEVATNQIEKRLNKTHNPLRTGIKGFDKIYKGLEPSEMGVIAAYRSVGKSALLNHILRHAHQEQGVGVMAFSAEVVGPQYALNLARSTARVDFSMRGGTIDEDKYERWEDAVFKMKEANNRAPFIILDESGMPIEEVHQAATCAVEDHGVGLIGIDYAQIVSTRESWGNENLRVAHISHTIQTMSNDLNVPVLVLSQRTEREGRRRTHYCPQLEHDADIVMYLEYSNPKFRDNPEMEPPVAGRTIAVTKHRTKGTGVCFTRFHKPELYFEHSPTEVFTPYPDDEPGGDGPDFR